MTEPWTHNVMTVNGFRMHYVTAGAGFPLVLLHGWPQTWYEWRKLIPPLAERFTIIAPDLRGLGDSERPIGGYDKRTLASDVYQLLKGLGHEQIGLIGHDWGGTVAYYLAYDHPDLVERLLILESTPGIAREGDQVSLQGIRRLWHLFFHGGNPDMAELLVRGNEELYLSRMCSVACYNPALFSQEEMAEYVRAYSQTWSVASRVSLLSRRFGRRHSEPDGLYQETDDARARLGRGALHGQHYAAVETCRG